MALPIRTYVQEGMEILSHFSYLPGFSFHGFEFCEHCLYGKQTQVSHKHRGNSRKDQLLTLVHSDLCGPMPNLSLGGAFYLLHSLMIVLKKSGFTFLNTRMRCCQSLRHL